MARWRVRLADALLGKNRRPTVSVSAIALGVILIAGPMAFEIFPELHRLPLVVRIGIAVGLVAVGFLGVRSAVRRETMTERDMASRHLQQTQAYRRARNRLLTRLVDPAACGIPRSYQITVYLYDKDVGLLSPIFPPWDGDGEDLRRFAPGNGATGQAYQRELDGLAPADSVMVVTGDAVSDETWHLSPEQRELWADHEVVASTALMLAGGIPDGAVTAIAKTNDDFFSGQAGNAALIQLARDIGHLLVVTDVPRETI